MQMHPDTMTGHQAHASQKIAACIRIYPFLQEWNFIGNCICASNGTLVSMYALLDIANILLGSNAHAGHLVSHHLCLGCFLSASLTLDLTYLAVIAFCVPRQT